MAKFGGGTTGQGSDLESTILSHWNVQGTTKKKIRVQGKEVRYTFKFNDAQKMADSGKFYTQMRDARLRGELTSDAAVEKVH